MMTCEDFELLLADALDDELSPPDRARLEAHLTACETCRRDYESSRDALVAMRQLSGPQTVAVQRVGDRLVIDLSTCDEAGAGGESASRARPDKGVRRLFPGRSMLRYAAGLAFAFFAGYLANEGFAPDRHIGNIAMVTDHTPQAVTWLGRRSPGRSGTLQHALVSAYTQRSAGTDLAKCLRAISRSGS